MVQPRSLLPFCVVEGEVTTSGSLESRIEVVHKGGGQVMPVVRSSTRRFPISGIQAAVPVTGPEGHGKGIKKRGVVREGLEKREALRGVSVGVQVHDLKGVTAHRHLGQSKPLIEPNKRALKGV